jgi:Sec-independent protein translocase protein TatA
MKLTEAAKKIGKVMGEYKEGKLKSSSGQKVKSRDQAVAIAMSEAGRSLPSRGGRTATNRGKK